MADKALASFMDPDWHLALNTLVDDNMTSQTRIDQLQQVVGEKLRTPLANALSKEIDMSMVPAAVKSMVFDTIVNNALNAIVAVCVKHMAQIYS